MDRWYQITPEVNHSARSLRHKRQTSINIKKRENEKSSEPAEASQTETEVDGQPQAAKEDQRQKETPMTANASPTEASMNAGGKA